jgi:hypothetical protein
LTGTPQTLFVVKTTNMLTYNTALKLKEAGFPKIRLCEREDAHEIEKCSQCDEEHYPTLEELIEACPNNIDGEWFTLTFSPYKNKWLCGYEKYEMFTPECWGETPSEAVAALYLALNKK